MIKAGALLLLSLQLLLLSLLLLLLLLLSEIGSQSQKSESSRFLLCLKLDVTVLSFCGAKGQLFDAPVDQTTKAPFTCVSWPLGSGHSRAVATGITTAKSRRLLECGRFKLAEAERQLSSLIRTMSHDKVRQIQTCRRRTTAL
jgi:hypothetical protein